MCVCVCLCVCVCVCLQYMYGVDGCITDSYYVSNYLDSKTQVMTSVVT